MPSRILIPSATLVPYALLPKKYQMPAVPRILVDWKSLLLVEKLAEMGTLVDALLVKSAASAENTTHALKHMRTAEANARREFLMRRECMLGV